MPPTVVTLRLSATWQPAYARSKEKNELWVTRASADLVRLGGQADLLVCPRRL